MKHRAPDRYPKIIETANSLPLARWARFWEAKDLTVFADAPLGSIQPVYPLRFPEDLESILPFMPPKSRRRMRFAKALHDAFDSIEAETPDELRDMAALRKQGKIEYFRARRSLAEITENKREMAQFDRLLAEEERDAPPVQNKVDFAAQIADVSMALKIPIPADSTSLAVFWRMQVQAKRMAEDWQRREAERKSRIK